MGEKFQAIFSIPHFLMKYSEENSCEDFPSFAGQKEASVYSFGKSLKVIFSGVNPIPAISNNEKSMMMILGNPIIKDGIDKHSIIELLKDGEKFIPEILKGINGEFIIFHFDKLNGNLTIVNDRFTSIPLYFYYEQEHEFFLATPYFTDLWLYLKKINKLRFNQEAFFEFLWFQRLFGTKTYAKNVVFLPDASILKITHNKLLLSSYWRREYGKSSLSLSEHAHLLAELVKKSIKNKTSDEKRYGHFLSGGMDSRSVLAAFEKNFPVCFTAALSENRELRTARNIALTKGAKHVFLELDPEHYGKILKTSVHVAGGMYNYDHGLFYGFNKIVQSLVDVAFHGHGFDYMFQGMYIPGKNIVIGGHSLYLRYMIDLPSDDNLVNYFINNASYRIKNADIWNFILPERKKQLKDFQYDSISEIYEKGKKLTENSNDLWEYLTFHHLSRHYSYPNHASIATFVEQRVISFDNRIFDLYLSLPASHRFNGKIEKKSLKILDPRLARIWSANTNLPVTASSWTQTAYQIGGFIKRRFAREEGKSEWMERTWPSREYALRNQKTLNDAVNEICGSKVLEQLDFLDCKKINDEFPRWLKGEDIPGISGDFVQTVLTLGTFLRI